MRDAPTELGRRGDRCRVSRLGQDPQRHALNLQCLAPLVCDGLGEFGAVLCILYPPVRPVELILKLDEAGVERRHPPIVKGCRVR